MKIPGVAISHQIITHVCRSNRGPTAAFDEAAERLKKAYSDLLAKGVTPDTELHVALVVQSDRHRQHADAKAHELYTGAQAD